MLGHLGALVDKSLVHFGDIGGRARAGTGCWRPCGSTRPGGWTRWAPAVAEAARIAHRDYYLALSEAAAPHLVAADQVEWLDRLDAELGNLRAAIAFSLTQADPEPGLRLATSLRVFWRPAGTPPREPTRCGRS